MLAASAHVTNAKPANQGDAANASQPGVSADGFNGALAALMSQLGPPPPAAPPTPPPAQSRASEERGASSGSATATSSSAAPSSANNPAPSNNVASGNSAVASPAASANAAGSDPATAAPGDASQGGASDALLQLAALTAGQNAPATTPAVQGADGAATPAATQAPQLDPRLIQFIARGGTAATTPSAATNAATRPTDPAAAGQGAAPTAADVAAQADAAATSASARGASAPVASAALLTLVPPSQLMPISAPAPQPAAGPAKSSKTAQLQAALGADATKSLASAALPAVMAGKPAIAASADTQSDVTFALPHDDGGQGSLVAQASSNTSGAGDQIGQQTSLAAPPAAAMNATPPAAALASTHGAEITAQLAAQISSRANAPRTAFDFALEPQGLGRVDVTLKFDSQGQLSAVLSFDNPNAAAEARSRAGDLQQALHQAGFDVGQSGLSFTSSGGQGHGAAWQSPAPSYAPAPVLTDSVAEAISPTTALGATGVGGLDITI